MEVTQKKMPDPSKFSNLPQVKKEVFDRNPLPRKRFLNLTLSGSQKKVADATEIIQTYLDARKEKESMGDPLFKLGMAVRKLEAAIKQGDASDSTLLILGAAYALEGHIDETLKACFALRERGAHSYENILGAMVSYGFYQTSKRNGTIDYGDRIVYFHKGKENEARGRQLLNSSPIPDIVFQILEVKKAQTGMFD